MFLNPTILHYSNTELKVLNEFVPTKQFLAAKSRWMQFFDSKYLMPAAASKHIFISCASTKLVDFFLKNVSRDPPEISVYL